MVPDLEGEALLEYFDRLRQRIENLDVASPAGLIRVTVSIGVSGLDSGDDAPDVILRRADEAFITSTAGGIMPVSRVDGEALGSSAPGRITAALSELYWRKHGDPAWTTPVNYDLGTAEA